jgi:hypothetical protein
MPTPVSYLSGASLSNTVGMFKRGTIAQNLKTSLESGYRWWNGIEVTSSQYLIYSDTFTLGTTTQANATPVAYSTPDLTDQSLLNLINTLPPRIGQTAFTSLPIALQWLQSSNKFFLIRGGTENIVKSNLEVYLDAGRYDSYIGDGTTVNDLSGNGRGSTLTNGASFNTSGVGSFVLDGTDDKIVGNTFTPNITNKTLCGWVKLSNVTQSGGGLINIQGAAGEPFDAIVYNETGQGWGFGSTGFARTAWSGYKETSTTQWVFMCATYANNNYNLYRNGVLILNTTSYNAYTFNVSCRVQMGERHTGGSGVFLAGNVACGMLYSKALSPEEVLQNFNAQKYRFGYYDYVQDGLVLNLDAGNYISYPRSGTTWTDLTGRGNNGTLTNGPTFSGGTTPSIVFDKSDDRIQVPAINVGNNFTVGILCRPTTASRQTMIANSYTYSNENQTEGFLFNIGNNGTDMFISLGRDLFGKVSPTGLISGNTWFYTCASYNGTTIKLYFNGVDVGGYFFGSPINVTYNTNPLFLGSWNYNGTNPYEWFGGNMSVAHLYNRALSPQEIIQNFESIRVNYGITGITTNGLVLNLDAANTASYNGSGTTWADISGSEFDGVLTNGPTYSNSGASSSISFDGTDDYVNSIGTTSTFSFIQNTGIYTISAWVKPAVLGTAMYFAGNNSGTGGEKGFYFGKEANNNCWLALTNGSGTILDHRVSNFFLNTTDWVHVTCVGNSTTNQFYKNGTAFGNAGSITSLATGTSSQTLALGSINNVLAYNYWWNGSIANFQIYNQALTASEVLQNYNAQKSRFGL